MSVSALQTCWLLCLQPFIPSPNAFPLQFLSDVSLVLMVSISSLCLYGSMRSISTWPTCYMSKYSHGAIVTTLTRLRKQPWKQQLVWFTIWQWHRWKQSLLHWRTAQTYPRTLLWETFAAPAAVSSSTGATVFLPTLSDTKRDMIVRTGRAQTSHKH